MSQVSPPKTTEVLSRIWKRYQASLYENQGGAATSKDNRVPYSPKEFEDDISELLEISFPYSRISGPRIFSPEKRLTQELGVEVDNILHIRQNEVDHIVVVEAKKQAVRVKGDRWEVQYPSRVASADRQIENHIRTLAEYLEPYARGVEVRFTGIVCSVAPEIAPAQKDGPRNSPLHLIPVQDLLPLLHRLFDLSSEDGPPRAEVLRVTQSPFLDVLRMGLAVKELGHPELPSAIRYVDRCRRSLDQRLFEDFSPTSERWAINGSAGMGKSVLLGYAAVVFSSGHELATSLGDTFPIKANKTFEKIGFKGHGERSGISIIAMSAKQLENLQHWFDFFAEAFKKHDKHGAIRFRQPNFVLCRDAGSIKQQADNCSVMLVDEAHDLPAYAALEIADKYNERGFYLVVACDRHQRLRLSGSDAKIIEGLDFRLKSRQLRQIYRNPASTYIVSLAIMFRWFARGGPKVIPTQKELRESFGFDVGADDKGNLELSMQNDAHPANSWCHTVATFASAGAAFEAISKERMGPEEVLWVRFSEEDPDFDYERLRAFTYHNCRSFEAHKISDKYVKGQEYPVVVIEGFPSFMDRYDAPEGGAEHEAKMWAFRREVYLCASRSTCFLYFICNPMQETPENVRIGEEIAAAVKAVALPVDPTITGSRTWSISIAAPDSARKMDVFEDVLLAGEAAVAAGDGKTAEDEGTGAKDQDGAQKPPAAQGEGSPGAASPETPGSAAEEADQPPRVIRCEIPVTPKKLAEELGVRPYLVVKTLYDIAVFASLGQDLLDRNVIDRVCKNFGARFEEIPQANAATAASAGTPQAPAQQVAGQNSAADTVEAKPSSPPQEPKTATAQPAQQAGNAFRNSIEVDGEVSVGELSRLLGITVRQVIKLAHSKDKHISPGTVLDLHTITVIAARNGLGVKTSSKATQELPKRLPQPP